MGQLSKIICVGSALEQFDVLDLVSLPFLGSFTNVWVFLGLSALIFYFLSSAVCTGFMNSGLVAIFYLFRFLNQLFSENLLISKNIYF